MTSPTDARGTALAALDAVLRAHRHDAVQCGLEALRLLQAVGMTWHDLFGPVMAAEPHFRTTSNFAEARAIHAAEFCRSVHRTLFLTTPAQLAAMAVVLCSPDWADGEIDCVGTMLLHLDYQVLEEVLQPRFVIPLPRSA